MITHRSLLSAVVVLCAMYVVACGGSDGGVSPLPPGGGPLTGTWIQPHTDTWEQLDLSQSGGRVVGYHRFVSANTGSLSNPIPITGTAALPQATLQWTESGVKAGMTETYPFTLNVTLSADGDSLTGTVSVSGSPATPFGTFLRRSTP